MPLQVNRVKLKLKDPSVEGGWADGDLLFNAEAEAWAKGTQNGMPIAKPDGGIIDTSYAHEENNAKYYADQANASVNNIASVLLNGNLAQAFNSDRSYAKGEYVLDQGILYKFTEDHVKGTSIADDPNAIEIKVAEDMSSFSNSLKDITGCQPIKFSNPELRQYVVTNGNSVSWSQSNNLPNTQNTLNLSTQMPYRWAMVECNEGDIFTINGAGGRDPRLWAFVNQDHQVIDPRAGQSESATNLIKIAPAGAKWLIINDKTNSNSYIGKMVSIESNIEETKTEITKNVVNLQNGLDKMLCEVPFEQSDAPIVIKIGSRLSQIDGINYNNPRYARTNVLYSSTSAKTAVFLDNLDYEFAVFYYGTAGSTEFLGSSGYGQSIQYIPFYAKRIGLSFRRLDLQNMTEENDKSLIQESLKAYNLIDNSLTQFGKAADAKATGDAISALGPDNTLSTQGQAADAKTVGDIINSIIQDKIYSWDSIASEEYPMGWRTGYYNTDKPYIPNTSNLYICTADYFTFAGNITSFTVQVPNGYGVRIHEYDETKTYLSSIGIANPAQGELTQSLTFNPKPNYYYKFSIGKFSDASSYINNEFLSTVTLIGKEIKSLTKEEIKSLAKEKINSLIEEGELNIQQKLDKTGDYEFFSVEVPRPLAFGGEEIKNRIESVECVLRLPNNYTPAGTPTRLILACHGASSYIEASKTAWSNSYWKSFMDNLLNAGYAVFDANIFPTSQITQNVNDRDTSFGRGFGSPLHVNVLKHAYDYIVEHYNVYPQIFAHGTSMGGVCASAFVQAYPELVLAQSSFAGRDITLYLNWIRTNSQSWTTTYVEEFPRAYGYESSTELINDHFSHIIGGYPSLSLLKISSGTIQMPPDRNLAFNNWVSYYSMMYDYKKDDGQGTMVNMSNQEIREAPLPDYIARRIVPYKSWNCWEDGNNAMYAKIELILQKAYAAGGSAPYYCVVYDHTTATDTKGNALAAHTVMSYGMEFDMQNQLITWFKRWE